MRSVSLSTSAGILVALLWLAGLGGLLVPVSAHADGIIPVGCVLVAGVIVCTDGAVGDTGETCVTTKDGQKSCINSQPPGRGTPGAGSGKLGPGLGSVAGMPQQQTSTGWLSRLTGWFSYALNQLFAALVGFLRDLVLYTLSVVLSVVLLAIASIPVPDWIASNSMGSLLGQTGSIVGFFMGQLHIPAALGLIGAGYTFRLVRKFVTLFQW